MKRKIKFPEREKVVEIRNLNITFGDRQSLSVRVNDIEVAKIRQRVDESSQPELLSFIEQAEQVAGQIFDRHMKGRIDAQDPEKQDHGEKKKSGKKKQG